MDNFKALAFTKRIERALFHLFPEKSMETTVIAELHSARQAVGKNSYNWDHNLFIISNHSDNDSPLQGF